MINILTWENKCRFLVALILLSDMASIAIPCERDTTTTGSVRQHIHALASDETEGRFTGSTGYKMAADYAVGVFKNAGLKPSFTSKHGESSYFQTVPLLQNTYGANTTLTIRKDGRDEVYQHSVGSFAVVNPAVEYEPVPMASPVFVGYGICEPKYGWNDVEGLDVNGKWVILMEGLPEEVRRTPAFPDRLRRRYAYVNSYESRKIDALHKRQVAGVIVLPNENTAKNWEATVIRLYRFRYLRYALDNVNRDQSSTGLPILLIHPMLAQKLMDGQAFNPFKQKGFYHAFPLKQTEIKVGLDVQVKRIQCCNVSAVLMGSDPKVAHETITMCAHLDHLGKVGDNVYNGANDNASGCVTVLRTAEALASHSLKRSVMFTLFTGEESGLIGSRHFVNYPPLHLEKMLLNINIEQVGSKHRDVAGLWAIGPKAYGRYFLRSGGAFDAKTLQYDNIDENVAIISGTDTEPFYDRGIPSILVGCGGFTEYHTPNDDTTLIDFEQIDKVTLLLQTFIQECANR